ncbi:hypothetical protein L1987_87369 [Smallanthus sonchifolius]|nr:hypothetical protein L1987_87369 [Smallanthus sonchifolius]
MMSGIVVIFDFDNTITDIDSDNWVVDELGATDQFNQLFPTVHWNSLMMRFADHHMAALCPPNMCKLVEGDFMMPRKDFPVWDLICKNRHLVKSEVHEWSSGEDFERILLHLITSGISMEDMKNNVDNTNTSHSFDCKFETIALEA